MLRPSYNRAGALAQVSLDGEVLIRQLAYNARGQRLLLARGNGLLTRYAYDGTMFRLQRLRTEGYQATDLTLTPLSGTTRQDTGYAYDLSGNITALTERAPQSGVGGTDELARGFTYDALYRLLSATGRENQPTAARPWQESTRSDGVQSTTAYTQRYSYDQLGNIERLRHTAANSADSFTRTFDYGAGATNYLQQVALAGAQVTYQYDVAGNVTQENGSRHFQWDAADQLRQFATWTGAGSAPTLMAYYVYAGGQRVKKLTQTSADTWQVTVYAEGGFEHRYEVSQGTRSGEQTQVAVLDGQHRLYQRRTGDALGDQRPDKLYALDDHLGSAAAQTDAGGQLVSREEYYPFGETSFGSTQKQRYRYCGKELDDESGLYYYGMRYYAAWLCRFVSVDPLAAQYTFYTPYQYAGNKPINAYDLDGAEERPVTDTGGQGSANISVSPGEQPSQAMPQDATAVAPVHAQHTTQKAENKNADFFGKSELKGRLNEETSKRLGESYKEDAARIEANNRATGRMVDNFGIERQSAGKLKNAKDRLLRGESAYKNKGGSSARGKWTTDGEQSFATPDVKAAASTGKKMVNAYANFALFYDMAAVAQGGSKPSEITQVIPYPPGLSFGFYLADQELQKVNDEMLMIALKQGYATARSYTEGATSDKNLAHTRWIFVSASELAAMAAGTRNSYNQYSSPNRTESFGYAALVQRDTRNTFKLLAGYKLDTAKK